MALIGDGGLPTRRVRYHECEVSIGSEFEDFGRALISIVTVDEFIEDDSSSRKTKPDAYVEHRGSSSYVIPDDNNLF
ncbi:hypothetical protein Csa_020938 [Cucumis sativus]|uniref:Uncharacterized protein n=1 Tax=Cucumis sativus TaxID=3659 RepID=A0A0A0KCZ9_CUCSA|nr:hypothetical protein Csa_020938 [Cucumis sativus]